MHHFFNGPESFCDSVSPADSAEVAAPMQKLCVLYNFVSSPTSCKIDNKFVTESESDCPSSRRGGLAVIPLMPNMA